ncbi:MAG TPA: SDR family NAD(P)-dependent oxidoreductase, partial [Candidatus Omnitrophota bacterium]|nr:SDR family NAD(P)-dependent oxidoreductase [Candidatus Omnitrophota bacterium]
METNFFGVQNVTREVIPLMRQRKHGKIINISSVSGFSASPAFGAYNASKWALEGFSESLRYELKLFGIDVLLIEPGVYKTKIFYENSRHAASFNNPESPYYMASQYLNGLVMQNVNDCHKDIEEVPRLIEKLIRAANPSFRNIPDIESKVMYVLRKFLPFSIYSWIIRTALFGGMKTWMEKQQTSAK